MRFILNWSMPRFQTRIIHWWFLRPFSTFLVVESMAVAICGLAHILRAMSTIKCLCLLTVRSLTLKSTSLSCLCLAMQSGQCAQRLRVLCRHGLMLGIVHNIMSVIRHTWRWWYIHASNIMLPYHVVGYWLSLRYRKAIFGAVVHLVPIHYGRLH